MSEIFVWAVGPLSASTPAGVDGGAEPVGPAAVLIGNHVGTAMLAPEEAAEDVDVLFDVGLTRRDVAPLVPLEEELEPVEELFVQNGLVVILDGDPLILRPFFDALAIAVLVVDVMADMAQTLTLDRKAPHLHNPYF